MTTPTPRNPPAVQDQPYVEVFTEIGAIEHYLRAAVIKHLPEGMTHAHFEMLQWFMRYGDGQTPAELARMMLLTKGAITNILQKLEKMGFVVVLADCADRRKKRVKITRAGLEASGAIMKDMKAKTEALRDGFTDDEFRAVTPFLKALRVFLSEISELGAPAAAHR
ncbi:MarR family transcriptional regulator [Phenylobacterium sp.]|uniref:MarR family winged helix-turn-helix transcriptional regulator n=1 Tax=Phenylobacterium sp. TaxID=1871053 RepID=UPI0030F3DEA2